MDTNISAGNSIKRSGRSNSSSSAKCKGKEAKMKLSKKPSYRHIPHSEKPPHLVARRNERERRRVQAVNSAFLRLRKYVPHEPRNKRLSKFKTLKFAIQYIHVMQDMIQSHDCQLAYKRQNFACHTKNSVSNRFDISSSSNQRHNTVKSDPLLQEISSNFISVLNPADTHGQLSNGVVRYERCNDTLRETSNNYTGKRPTFNANECKLAEYRRYGHVETVCPRQRYTAAQYDSFHSTFPYQTKESLFPYQVTTLTPRLGDASNSSSPGYQVTRQGQECGQQQQRNFCHFSDYSYQPQTPSTSSSHTDSWEDCASDISCSTSQELTPPLESIPSFHQVISFLDTENYNNNNSIMRDDVEYPETGSTYDSKNVGFSVNCSSSTTLIYSKSCLTG